MKEKNKCYINDWLLFKINENYFEIKKVIFEAGLFALMRLIIIFSKIIIDRKEKDFVYMVNGYFYNAIINIYNSKDANILNYFKYCINYIQNKKGINLTILQENFTK